MCFHNKLSKTALQIENRFNAKFIEPELFQPIHHTSGFAHPKWPVITTEDTSVINQYGWGLIPFWVKSKDQVKDIRIATLNAKSETVFDLPSFRSSIGKKRCIVISDGFFEWQDVNKNKFPYHISVKSNEIFSFAGLFDSWTDKETGEEIKTFSILTCEANPLMASIHNIKKRMPVILPKELEKDWLTPEMSKEDIKSFFKMYPEDDMQAYTISKLITSRKESSNVPQVHERFEYEELK